MKKLPYLVSTEVSIEGTKKKGFFGGTYHRQNSILCHLSLLPMSTILNASVRSRENERVRVHL